MDSREAKEILLRYRPGGGDAGDPQMAEALQQVHRDPELAAWFEQQNAVHAAIRAKFKEIPVPPGLKREIIIGQAEQARVVRLPGVVKILAAAAAIVVLSTIAWFSFNRPENHYTFTTFRDRMTREIQRGVPYMDMQATNQADIIAFCQNHGGPTNVVVPANMAQLPGEGGSVLSFNNQKVTMLCLNATSPTNGATKNDLWLFVVDKSVLPDPPPDKPEFLPVADLMTASWTDGGKVFVLAAAGSSKDLQKYLPN